MPDRQNDGSQIYATAAQDVRVPYGHPVYGERLDCMNQVSEEQKAIILDAKECIKKAGKTCDGIRKSLNNVSDSVKKLEETKGFPYTIELFELIEALLTLLDEANKVYSDIKGVVICQD